MVCADDSGHRTESQVAGRTRESTLYRWGAGVACRWRLVLLAGLAGLILGAAAYPYLRTHLTGLDWEADGTESAQVDTFIERHFPAQGAEQDLVVFEASGQDVTVYRPAIERVVAAVRASQGVTAVSGPFDTHADHQVSPTRRVALAVVGLAGDPAARATHAEQLQKMVARTAAGSPVQARLTGLSPVFNDEIAIEESSTARGETIGITLALVVLVLALGSLVAAVVPLLVTATSLAITFGALALASVVVSFDSFVISCATMIGTGIAIDYSLFVVSRFREELLREEQAGALPQQATVAAVAAALATSGRTVLVAGTVVAASLCSLFVLRASIYREIAIAIALAVACTLLCAMTALPALLSALGARVNRLGLPVRWQPAELQRTAHAGPRGWARWARWVMRHPLLTGGAAALILLTAAWPLTALHYGLDLGMSSLQDTPSGTAATVLSDSFTPGALAPIQIACSGRDGHPLDEVGTQQVQSLVARLQHNPHVAAADVHRSGGYGLITVTTSIAVDTPAAINLVDQLRADAISLSRDNGVALLVGGPPAKFIDLGRVTRSGTPLVLILVLGVSLLLLVVMFRSVALAVKAILMNLLTTAAAIGLTVAVFQWGWLSSELDFASVGYLQHYMPIAVFAVVFGLSMDYQVFLIRRIREEWLSTGDNTRSVVTGIAHTARPITAAAAIMVCVFGSFVTSNVLEMKQIGFGLAVAIALDAVLVRLVLVPALMRLLGPWNWWLPDHLARRLPGSD